jgi:NAD(P)H-dependent flavin oxidoreductase YrpB (nitropropane dioxygenase family)
MLGIEYPILSAGMGPSLIGESTGAPVGLVVAVSEAGGLGVLGAAGYTIEQMREAIHEIRKRTNKPFGVDLLLPSQLVEQGDREVQGPKEVPLSEILKSLPPPYYDWLQKVKAEMRLPDTDTTVRMDTTTMQPLKAVKACIEEKVPLFCSGLGNPGFMVEEAHANGMKVLGITGNSKNARRMAQSGVDLIVAQGYEGGGHTGRIGTMALLPQAIDAASPVPILAAGGIGDGRGVAAALAMGCIGVWVGTRFLATKEGGIPDVQKEHILRATDEDTRRTYIYTGKTSRVIYNRLHDLWEESGLEPLPFPVQITLASGLVDMFFKAKKYDYVAPFSGQVSGLIHEIKPAGQVLEEMVEQTVDILTRRLPENVKAS